MPVLSIGRRGLRLASSNRNAPHESFAREVRVLRLAHNQDQIHI